MNRGILNLHNIFNHQFLIILLPITLFISIIILSFFAFKIGRIQGLKTGWNQVLQNKNIPEGNYILANHIIYRLEGKIVEIKPDSIVLQSENGEVKEFSTKHSSFDVLSDRFDTLPEIKNRIIDSASVSKNFTTGDDVILLVRSNQLSGNIDVTKVIKIKSE